MNFEDMNVSEILRRELGFAVHVVYFVDKGKVFGVRDVNKERLRQIWDERRKLMPSYFVNESVEKEIRALSAEEKLLRNQSRYNLLFRYGRNIALRSARKLNIFGRTQRDRITGYGVFLEYDFEDEPLTQGFASGIREMLERERNKYFGISCRKLEAA